MKKSTLYKNVFGLTFLFTLLFSNHIFANVTVTAATGGSAIPKALAANGCVPTWTTLGNMVITEGVNTDIIKNKTNATIVLSAPAGWNFNNVAMTASISGPNMSSASVAYTSATSITVTWTTNAAANGVTDVITISGVQVRATATTSASGSITQSATTVYAIPGITSGTTNFGTLTLINDVAPSVTTPPSNQTVCVGSATSLSVVGAGTNLTYQWRKGGVNITNGGTVSGATTATLSISSVVSGDAGTYDVVISGGNCATATSSSATLSISSPTYATFPYSQGFESWVNGCGTTDRPDASWLATPVTGNNSWRRDDQGASASWSGSSGSYSPVFSVGAHSARFHSYDASSSLQGSMDLYINCSSGTASKQITFDCINADGSDILAIYLSTNGGTSFAQIGSNIGVVTAWTTQSISFTSSSATTVIRLIATSDYGFSDIGVDNFSVCAPSAPNCASAFSPANAATGISKCGPTISWTAPASTGCNTASSYYVYFGTSSTPPLFDSTSSTSYCLGILSSTTVYYWKIVPKNSGGNASGCTTQSFTTNAVACTVCPGGISSGITIWLKGGAGLTTSGVNVTGWADQSGAATSITVNGSPDYVASGYNFNPYIDFTLSNGVGGDYLATPDLYLRSFFWVAKLKDLTRKSSHLATYDQVTYSFPCGLCAFHGGENGTSVAEFSEYTYGNANFQSAGVWRKNGNSSGINYNTAHSGSFNIVSALGTGTASLNRLFGGQVDNPGISFVGSTRDWYGPVGEVVCYSTEVTASQANRIETYLGVKYGITLGDNGATTTGYTATSGTTVWTAGTGYHYDVTGIGAEAVEGLQQNKSQSINVPTASATNDMPFTIAHTLISAATNVPDNEYAIVGHNNATISGTYGLLTHGATAIQVLQNRIFRIQTTNYTGTNLEIEFDMSKVPGNGGALGIAAGVNNPANLRLLLDNNTTFGQGVAAEKTYTNSGVSGNLIKFLIPIADLGASATMYFRIASTSYAAAPLPIELKNFSAQCDYNKVDIKWTTATETNNHFFTIERSADANNFSALVNIPGAGNSTQPLNYNWTDDSPLDDHSYYRLKQTDFNGESKMFDVVSVKCGGSIAEGLEITNTHIVSDKLFINFATSFEGPHTIRIYDTLGKLIVSENKMYSVGNNSESVDINRFSKGIYFISIQNDHTIASKKGMFLE